MAKFYNCNRYGHCSNDYPKWALMKGEDQLNVWTDDADAINNKNDDNSTWGGSSKAETMLAAMDIYNCNPSYDSYDFSQRAAISSNATTTTKPRKTYLEAGQGQGTPPSPPETADRSTESFNKSNHSISVWYVLLNNQYTVDMFSNHSLLTNINQA